MKPVTLVVPYYDNPEMLRIQQEHWRSLPDELKRCLHIVVIDDASPQTPALDVLEPTGVASFRLYRTLVDVRWNDKFARNLGAHVSETDWLVLTDIDHVVPEATLAALISADHDPRHAYRFERLRMGDMAPREPHQNTWFLTRQLFDEAGGYDERLSGYHGGDHDFFVAVHTLADEVVMLHNPVLKVPRRVVADATTSGQKRRGRWQVRRIGRIKKRRARDPNWRPLRLTFPYEQLL